MFRFLIFNLERIKWEIHAILSFLRYGKIRNLIAKASFVGDGLITRFDTFFNDPNLIESFNRSFNNIPKHYKSLRDLQLRFQILVWSMKFTRGINGDVVECGVWYGVLSRALLNYFNEIDDRNFFLFDSWGEPGFKIKGFYKLGNYQEDIFQIVQKRFPDTKVSLIRGYLPKSLRNKLPQRISLLMIDLNSGIVESQVLNKCWSRIPRGGIIYFDDYNSDFPKITSSINRFMEKHNQNLLIFPSGQALVIKQ